LNFDEKITKNEKKNWTDPSTDRGGGDGLGVATDHPATDQGGDGSSGDGSSGDGLGGDRSVGDGSAGDGSAGDTWTLYLFFITEMQELCFGFSVAHI
jgi:hypothetical protein